MNRVHKVVWSQGKRLWQVVSELGRSGRGLSSGDVGAIGGVKTIAAGTLFLIALPAHASSLPSGGTVVGGQGSINSSGNTLTVNQNSQNMAINWQDFSIAEGHTVNFVQPNAQAAALNRVTGNNVSDIRGALNANGRVFLVNPNGVMFSSTARVDVGSLVASTLDISTEDFMAGNYHFEGASANAIINEGNITTAEGGVVAMIAAELINTGSITTPQGSTLMGAGSKVTLDLGGPVKIEVEEALLDTYIEQGGAIRADGGLVYLTAKAAGDLAASVINHTGITEARTLAAGPDGRIMLMGDMDSGQVQVAGTLDASAPTAGDGGFIETSAAKVVINDVQVSTRAENGQTGEWLIDPNDYTIAASGGDITGAQLSTNLGNTNVTIQSIDGGNTNGNGDIFVNDEVTWSSGNTLTLNAIRNIEINSTIDASGGDGGKLVLEYGQGAVDGVIDGQHAYYLVNAPVSLQASGEESGINTAATNFSTQLGSAGDLIHYTTITNNDGAALNTQLHSNVDGNFALTTDITLTGTNNWTPVGNWPGYFSGQFEGLGHSITGLNMDIDDTHVAMFRYASDAYIGNLHLADVSIANAIGAGALVGYSTQGSLIINASSTGAIEGRDNTGGLVGINFGNILLSHSNADVTGSGTNSSLLGGLVGSNDGVIANSYATGRVEGHVRLGGLVGYAEGSITNSYATGEVGGSYLAGGLVGDLAGGEITHSFATGNVEGEEEVGGLVGSSWGFINNSYATGIVEGTNIVGGLVGYSNWGDITNSYATGDVHGADNVGGLVGVQIGGVSWYDVVYGTITNSYASNSVSAPVGALVGGLVGLDSGFVSNSYYDSETNAGVMNDSSSYGGTRFEILRALPNLTSWSSEGNGASVAGYEVAELPYLVDVTRASDKSFTTLFEGGVGVDGDAYTITNWNQLQNINFNTDVLTGGYYFALSDNLGMDTAGYNEQASASANNGAGWNPIGSNANKFTGTFDGSGHVLDSLVVNRSSENFVGLFGYTDAATLQNFGVTNANITGRYYVGSIAGGLDGNLSNAFSSGSEINGIAAVGGVVGSVFAGSIDQVYSADSVTGQRNTGGFVGLSQSNQVSTISNSYSASDVTIAAATESSNQNVGGLVGINNQSITNSYASGTITGATATNLGGLVGSGGGTVTNSYWDTETSGLTTSAGGEGKTTAELQTASTFYDWDLSTTGGAGTWRLYEGQTSPLLRSFMTVATVSGTSEPISRVYDATTQIDNELLDLSWATANGSTFNSSLVQGQGFSLDTKNVGARTLTHDLYSSQMGYDIIIDSSLTNAEVEVTPFALSLDGLSAADRTYDATNVATLVGSGAINPFSGDRTARNPALDSSIQSVQQMLSYQTNAVEGANSGMSNLNLTLSHSDGIERIDVEDSAEQFNVGSGAARRVGSLQLFVVDGGINR